MSVVMLTANRLESGSVVWLTHDLSWTEDVRLAGKFDDEAIIAARDVVNTAEQSDEIVAAYEIAVDTGGEASAREMIRAAQGPSILPPTDSRVNEVLPRVQGRCSRCHQSIIKAPLTGGLLPCVRRSFAIS